MSIAETSSIVWHSLKRFIHIHQPVSSCTEWC